MNARCTRRLEVATHLLAAEIAKGGIHSIDDTDMDAVMALADRVTARVEGTTGPAAPAAPSDREAALERALVSLGRFVRAITTSDHLSEDAKSILRDQLGAANRALGDGFQL